MPEPCPICGNPSNAGSPMFRGRKEVTCDTCGQFQISDSGEAALKRLTPRIDAPNWKKLDSWRGLERSPILERTYFGDPRGRGGLPEAQAGARLMFKRKGPPHAAHGSDAPSPAHASEVVARHGRGVVRVVVRLDRLAPLVIASTPTRKRNAFVMADKSDDAKARAEARFNRELQHSRQDDALKAEIAAQARTVNKKTERLRALRLAKEPARPPQSPSGRMAATLGKTRASPHRR